eukprot:CAMPEP_0172520060 /NCGR_PEP_ID=MMETSP1066-20121228/291774_1 /TAXON_ID=671091 /ORGANISM="Coscinodiscus wailesii, Strain CCMP2513" /LENGTH=531 /DNA_ID=CAMNT_0013302751 /DNA_START=104 /DNA_END=1699 /DNA_ORIENTATION=+
MRLYFLLSVQTFLSDSLVQSASSLRNLKVEEVTQRELLENGMFDCDKGCDMTIGSPVCGDDDISYQNQCLAYCQNTNIKSAGECSGHHSMSDVTYMDVVVTMEQINRFKDDDFVFVAKRNFETSDDEHKVSNKHAESKNGVFYAHRMTHDGDEYVSTNIKSAGECSGHHSMSDVTYVDVVVTKEQINRFKDDNFIFVAKRNFETSDDEHKVSNKHAESKNGVFYAHRMTHDGDEYVSKIDLRGVDLNTNATTAQLPVWMVESNRRLQGSTRGGDSGNARGVVGKDTRSKVCLRESCYPYSTIGEFLSTSGGHSCTGTVISDSAVLTNAHCRFKDGKFTDISTFVPGRYRKYAVAYEPTDAGQVVTPYGVWSPQYWTILNGWYNAYELKYDIAIAHFNPKLYRGSDENNSDLNIGEYTGSVAIAATTNDSAELQKATVTGYPNDKPVGEMWTSGPCAGGFQAGYEDVITYHGCDSVKGNDGSALLDLDKKIAYGVDVAEVPVGQGDPDQVYVNLGVIFHVDNMYLIKMFMGE